MKLLQNAFGIFMLLMSGAVGIASAVLFCMTPEAGGLRQHWGALLFVVFGALFPGATVCFFRGPRWLPVLAYSAWLALPLWLGLTTKDYVLASAGPMCVAVALASARVCRSWSM